MVTRTFTVTTCDRCNFEQDNTALDKDTRLMKSITKIELHVPFLVTNRDGPDFLYDWNKNYDLCPHCRKALKVIIENFIRRRC